ncbi:septal ring lytic transglycosylase RlpA family protein [Flavobacterium sp. ARAG 55.4]|uniref:Septal ring lytic transglycosylase RlpA family protein n=1 Tax=Flavobacterium plantiphilum TaxID=3163297 RepID=A0ABW8XQZ4_9FLAO
MKKSITLLFLFFAVFVSAQSKISEKQKTLVSKPSVQLLDTLQKKYTLIDNKRGVVKDTLHNEVFGKLKIYKKSVHASYYADKFNGKRTASGLKFSNTDFTAAHKKFPFGTMLKITNEVNGKSIYVEVTDRGPFVKSREIDLTKRAFMEIAANKRAGSMIVTIEEVVE